MADDEFDEFQEWTRRRNATKADNHRARVEFEEGRRRESMVDDGYDRSDGTAWREREAEGGPHMEAEGPVSTRRADQSRGRV